MYLLPFLGSHTSDNISSQLCNMISNWPVFYEIGCKFIITDNGENIVAAAREMENWIWLPCFAHTLQLCISDAKKKVQTVDNLLVKARNIVSHFNHSAVAKNLLCKEQEKQNVPKHSLKQMIPTRWNSEFYMLRRLVEQKTCITNVLLESDTQNLSGAQWKLAEELVQLLQPLEEITHIASGENFPTLSQMIPCLYAFVLFLNENHKPGSAGQFGEALRDSIKLRFQNLLKSKVALSAMVLDPRYKLLILNDDEMLPEVTEAIKAEAKSVANTSLAEDTGSSSVQSTTSENKTDKRSNFWDVLETIKQNSLNKNNKVDVYELEFDRYIKSGVLERNADILKWWSDNSRNYPNLAVLARKYLSIPATEASSERLFSTAGNILTNKRSSLATENLAHLVYLHEFLKSSLK